LCTAIALASFVLRGAKKVDEMIAVVIPKVDPGCRDESELSRAIGLLDVDETGTLEQLAMVSVGGDGDRAIPVGAAPLGGTQSRCGVDREETRAPSGTEQ
jgi:hypothetical protein